jgi:hypothetical protein
MRTETSDPDAVVAPPTPAAGSVRWRALAIAAGRPVDGASLAVFRVVFGLVGLLSAVRLLRFGWVDSLYAGPTHHLRYPAMSWVPTLSPGPMRLLVVVVALAAVAVVLGAWTRVAAAVFWAGFSWMEFTEASVYLNHYWFITVAGLLLVFLPVSRCWSVDARRRSGRDAGTADRWVPAGAVWVVRAQVGVVYCFAGIAKLHGDWLVRGLPMSLWLPAKSDLPLVGELLALRPTAIALSWAGALFDCTVVLFLLWRRTRPWAWGAVVGFHVATWILFPIIGVFPWLMIGASTVFFDPDWPRRLLGRVRSAVGRSADGSAAVAPATWRPVHGLVLVVVGCWLLVQVALPMRYLLYPGDHRWSGEAYRFGWNVLLVEKAGDVVFRVTDTTTGATSRTDASDLYTPQQWRTMVNEPELIRQAAHAVAQQVASDRGVPVEQIQVRADAFVSFNGRAAQRLIDPEVDLAAEPWRLGHQRWILPVPTSAPPAGD